jgi:hypothetical protein
MSREDFNKRLFYTYMRTGKVWYIMPNYGSSGITYYRTFHQYVGNRNAVQISIARMPATGPGELYEEIKVVAIESTPTNNLVLPILPIIPTLDIRNYAELMREVGLEE